MPTRPTTSVVTNPFALMIDPQAVLAQVERSERLERLQRRICRPLDKPLVPMLDPTALVEGAAVAGPQADDAADASDEASASVEASVVDAAQGGPDALA